MNEFRILDIGLTDGQEGKCISRELDVRFSIRVEDISQGWHWVLGNREIKACVMRTGRQERHAAKLWR